MPEMATGVSFSRPGPKQLCLQIATPQRETRDTLHERICKEGLVGGSLLAKLLENIPDLLNPRLPIFRLLRPFSRNQAGPIGCMSGMLS